MDALSIPPTIDDPKTYSKPWVALDKLRFKLKSPSFDVLEMICSPSEFAEYNKIIGNPASEKSPQERVSLFGGCCSVVDLVVACPILLVLKAGHLASSVTIRAAAAAARAEERLLRVSVVRRISVC